MTMAFRVKVAVAALLAATLAVGAVLLLERSEDSPSNLRLAQMHFSSGNWAAADVSIRDAFLYDSLEEPIARSAWILRAKVAAAARGDDAGLDVAKTLVHIYHGELADDEFLELQNWFIQRGFLGTADLIRSARREQ